MMNYILVDTNKKNFLPLTYTRPVSDLRIGIFKISEKWEKLLGQKVSYLTESYLQAKFPVKFGETNVFINSKVLPTPLLIEQIEYLQPNQKLISGNDWVACCSKDNELNISSSLESFPADTDTVIEHWKDLFKFNGVEIENDIKNLSLPNLTHLSESNTVIGNPSLLFIHPKAKVEGVTFNTNNGSVFIDENSEVMEGSCIKGPFVLHSGSTIKMGAKIYEGTTIGPKCKVGGEVKNCVIQGYSNKSHDGYLGNSVVGFWVNLGADTNCSNLKNTFGEVSIWDYHSRSLQPSGETFIGCCIGDYSKTSINTTLNTGTTIGVNCNVFGDGFPPKLIPNFSWGHDNANKYRLDKAIESNRRMASFTGESIQQSDEEILEYLTRRRE